MRRLRPRLLPRLLGRVRDPSGFGLIEMMIALTVLAIATTALTAVFVTGHLTLRRASESDTAAVLSDSLLEQFRAETWDNIALDSSQVTAGDSTYAGDDALTDPYLAGITPTPMSPASLGYDITEANAPPAWDGGPAATGCTNTPEPATCTPSQTEVGPNGNSYRVDTYVTWGCPHPTETVGGTMSSPTCSDSNGPVPYAPVKVVTIVVRDASTLSPVYRSSTTFDRLGGGPMPTVTVSPS